MCISCYRKWLGVTRPEKNAAKLLRASLKKGSYGITPEQYLEMLRLQGGVCKLCGHPPHKKRLHTDHDHKTGRVRGLLCWRCNFRLLGRFSKPELLRKAAEYLESDFDGRKLATLYHGRPVGQENP